MVRIATAIIEQIIRGGTEYLAWLNSIFRGDVRLVRAAHLATQARVLRNGLAYASPQVFTYVSEAASPYRWQTQLPKGKKGGGKSLGETSVSH